MHSSATDDGFREIQLSGKQIVFLFIMATVVSAVIFLSGVFVGQGVAPVGGAARADASAAVPGPGEPPVDVEDLPGDGSLIASSEPTQEELTYYSRLEGAEPPEETLELPPAVPTNLGESPAAVPPGAELARSAARAAPPSTSTALASAAAPEVAQPPPPVASTPPPARPTPARNTTSEGSGYAVQVTALQAKEEAYSIAGRLIEKGYQAYVEEWASGASAPIYRVRVGRGLTSREADLLAARLEREESFDPWVTSR